MAAGDIRFPGAPAAGSAALNRRSRPGPGAAGLVPFVAPRAGLRPALFFAVAIIAVSPLIARAAGDDDVVALPPWIVEGAADLRLAAARDDSFASVLGPTSALFAGAWKERSIGTLAEALRFAPGVVLQESFGGFEPPRISIRGSGLDSAPSSRSVAMLVDGLPLARGDGSFHSGLFDPMLFSRVEVYRGTMHAGVTPAVLGGVINAASFSDRPAGTALRAEVGSFGALRARFHIDSMSAATRLVMAGSADRQHGWRNRSGQHRLAFNAAMRHSIGENTHAEATLYAARVHYEVPGPLTLADAMMRPRSVIAAVNRDKPGRWSSVVRLAAQLKSGQIAGNAAAGISVQRLDDRFRQLVSNGETESLSEDFNAHATLTRRFEIVGLEHHLLLRGTFSSGTNGIERFANIAGDRGGLFGRAALRSTTGAVSVEDLVWLGPDVAAGAGVTALSARREIVDRFPASGSVADISRLLDFDDLSARAGVLWRMRSGLALHAALSRGIEPPATEELLSVQGSPPDQGLRSRDFLAQRATTFEAGLRRDGMKLAWSFTAYTAPWTNEILRLADTNGQPRGAVNAGSTRHAGIEAALRWLLTDDAGGRIELSSTANMSQFHFDNDPVYGDSRLAGAPPFSGWTELRYDNPRGWFAALESSWVAGRTRVDHAGRLDYGGHALLHARAGWRFRGDATLFVSIRNVLDRRHIASTAGVLDLARSPSATIIFLPGNGRSLTIGLEWTR